MLMGHMRASQVFKGLLDDVQIVAIKYLTAVTEETATAASDAQLKYFESEISIMKACRFPLLVSFLGCWLQPVRCANPLTCIDHHALEASGMSCSLGLTTMTSSFKALPMHDHHLLPPSAIYCPETSKA